jgi:ribose transport system ATP-binding protein
VLLSTDSKELAGIADRVLVFSRGKIVAELEGGEVDEEHITGEALRSTAVRETVKFGKHPIRRWFTGDVAPVVVVLGAILLLSAFTQIFNPFFLSERSLTSILGLVATLGLAALAQSLVMMIGGIDLSIGPLMGLLVVIQSFFLVDGSAAGLQSLGWVLFSPLRLLSVRPTGRSSISAVFTR